MVLTCALRVGRALQYSVKVDLRDTNVSQPATRAPALPGWITSTGAGGAEARTSRTAPAAPAA
eukprot:5320278-Pyramimonas_sp.AAC.1